MNRLTFSWIRLLAAFGLIGVVAPTGIPAADDPKDLLNQAVGLTETGKSQEAVDLLTRVIQATPNEPFPYYFRGREYFRLVGSRAESTQEQEVGGKSPIPSRQPPIPTAAPPVPHG